MYEVAGQSLHVNMRSRKKTYFSGTVNTVTSINDKGIFDVLCLHANFISIIRNFVILDKDTPKEKKFIIGTGVLKVRENAVDIFLDV